MENKAAVIFKNNYIQNAFSGKKCRVWYMLDRNITGRRCIVIYSKSCLESMNGIIPYENNTDMMTDYFEKDRAVLFEDHPLYQDAKMAAEKGINDSKKRHFNRLVKKHGLNKALEYVEGF